MRTGYEQVIGSRTSDMFCVNAQKPGKVISVNKDGIIVEYNDGEKQGVMLGTRYGKAAGIVVPQVVTTHLKLNDTFEIGDNIAYNTGFFEQDVLNPKQVIWKSSKTVKTVLLESTDTIEDSSAISGRISRELTTNITKVRTIIVNFNNQVHQLVKAGSQVEYESILCIIEDEVSSGAGYLDEETIDTLRVLSAQSPQAKYRGKIDRIEVYYNGDKEDMSDSLRAIADESDLILSKRYKSIGKRGFTGSVDENFRVDNEPLAIDTVAIQIYITAKVPAGIGDKGVFANQMKTVFGRVFENDITTESGKLIDAIFGAKSIDDRIVLSPYLIGTTTTLLNVIGDEVIKVYNS